VEGVCSVGFSVLLILSTNLSIAFPKLDKFISPHLVWLWLGV